MVEEEIEEDEEELERKAENFEKDMHEVLKEINKSNLSEEEKKEILLKAHKELDQIMKRLEI